MAILHFSWLSLLLLQVTPYCVAYVYTSSEKMLDLAALERTLMKGISKRIPAATSLLEHRHKQMTTGDLGDDVTNHPNGAYLTFKSFVYSWQNFINLGSDFSDLLDDHRALSLLPTPDDLKGSMSAILRLQGVYDLPVDEMYAGNYSGYLGPPLDPLDALNIGKYGFEGGFLDLAIAWLELSLQKLRRKTGTETESDVETDDDGEMAREAIVAALGLLGRAYLYAGFAEKARELYKESITLDPSATCNTAALGSELKILTDKSPPTSPAEHWRKDMRLLCSRPKEHTVTEIRPGHVCRYKSSFTAPPYVRYREEIVSLDPYVSLFYNVIFDSEIEAVKQFAKGRLRTATVGGGVHRVTPSFVRTCDNCWINDADMPLVAKLSVRVTDITGLDTTSAEDLQVVNYGLAGHYDVHMDPFVKLSDVDKGGQTVFVDIGISVAPIKGMALFWYNFSPAMELENRTNHAGCPVLKGHKWIATKWIWTYGKNTFRRPCGLSPQSTQLDVEDSTYWKVKHMKT